MVKMHFKILLDKSTMHHLDYATLCPNICVEDLPPKTTSLIQPMVQGIINRITDEIQYWRIRRNPNRPRWSHQEDNV